MAKDVSIAISIRDNFSEAITTIRNSSRAFDKDMEGLQRKLNTLNNTRAIMKVDTDKSHRALREAEKQFAQTGDAADELNLKLANADYENARRNLGLVSKEAREAEKDMLRLADTTSRTENRVGGATSQRGIQATAQESSLAQLGKAGLGNMAGNAIAELSSSLIGSAFGKEQGTMLNSIISSTASGAALGSIAGPVGAVIGGGIGAISGAISGGTQIFENKDSAFKAVVQSKYEEAQQRKEVSMENGLGIAAGRETSLQSFTTLFGDAEQAKQFTEQIKDFANVTPFLYDDLANMGKSLKTYGYGVEELLPTMQAIGDAGAALGMSQSDMGTVATALGRMRTSGKTTTEYINLMLERGVPVYDYLAQSLGKSKEQVMEMVSKGLLPGEKSAKAIADYMGEDFSGSMEAQSKTIAGLQSTLQGMQDEMDNAMGEGQGIAAKRGLTAQINYLSGDSGEKIKGIYSDMGEWEQSLENAKQRLVQEYQDKALQIIEEQGLKGPDAYVKLQEAQIEAEAAWAKTEGAKKQAEINKSLINNTGAIMAEEGVYRAFGYDIGVELSKGMRAAMEENFDPRSIWDSDRGPFGTTKKNEKKIAQEYSQWQSAQGSYGINERSANSTTSQFGSFAFGLDRVPYDNFPALLHEGERVQTAAQARSQNGSVTIAKLADSIMVREEADIDRIAQTVVDNIIRARQVS